MGLDPTGFYADLAQTIVLPALRDNGFQAAIWVKGDEVFDPVQGIVTSPGVWGVNPCYAVYGGGMTGLYPGVFTKTDPKTLSRIHKKEMYLDAASLGNLEVRPDDLFQDENGNLFEILQSWAINPGGYNIAWRLMVGK